MAFYTLRCKCGMRDEFYFDANADVKETLCEMCGEALSVKNNRDWRADAPQLQTETVGYTYNYWDEGLGCHVKSKQHRKDEMEKRGLEPYTPDPELQKHRKEMLYAKKHGAKDDVQTHEAVQRESRAASSKRMGRAIDKKFDEMAPALERQAAEI